MFSQKVKKKKKNFGLEPSQRDWSNLGFSKSRKNKKHKELVCQIETLYLVMAT